MLEEFPIVAAAVERSRGKTEQVGSDPSDWRGTTSDLAVFRLTVKWT